MAQWAIGVYTDILEIALPIGIVFAIGNLIVGTIIRVGFGGKLVLK